MNTHTTHRCTPNTQTCMHITHMHTCTSDTHMHAHTPHPCPPTHPHLMFIQKETLKPLHDHFKHAQRPTQSLLCQEVTVLCIGCLHLSAIPTVAEVGRDKQYTDYDKTIMGWVSHRGREGVGIPPPRPPTNTAWTLRGKNHGIYSGILTWELNTIDPSTYDISETLTLHSIALMLGDPKACTTSY